MKRIAFALAAGLLSAAPTLAQDEAAQDAAPACELTRPVVFAGLDYDSAQFHNAVAEYIIEHGYGCQTDEVPGSVIPLVNGMARGDVDVNMEIWKDNITEAWTKAEAAGEVVDLGVNFPDATQGWYVPRYLVEGRDAPARGLKSVSDLPQFKELFADAEEPGKGRFYNCIAGWNCEVVNTRKLAAYGLDGDYTNFRPGSGSALDAAIESAILRKQPIVFYYWSPTWLMGKIGKEIVQLREPAYDPEIWKELAEAETPTRATAYPTVEVHVGANAKFAQDAPELAKFLTAYETNGQMVSDALAYMQDNSATAKQAAENFLRTHEDIWQKWVPAEVAGRVKAALAAG
jgi:glycine betaine/proline transport system substrate-binding protein